MGIRSLSPPTPMPTKTYSLKGQTDSKRPRALRIAFVGLVASMLSVACSQVHSSSLLSHETVRGKIQYTLHSPVALPSQQLILAHGFLRSPKTMRHLADSFAKAGIETACIDLRRARSWSGEHVENALDMIALRESLGWKIVTYAGFSAGGLSALIAASEDLACKRLLLLDPVDHAFLGKDAAPKIRVPTLAILGQPGPGNANRNATAMLNAVPDCRMLEIPEATHCHFEARPSALCHLLTGSKPDASRTAIVHEAILSGSSRFLRNQTATKP